MESARPGPPVNTLAERTYAVAVTVVRTAFDVMTYCPKEQTGGRVPKDRRLSRLLR